MGLVASNKNPGDNDKLARDPRCRTTGVPGGTRIVLRGVNEVGRLMLRAVGVLNCDSSTSAGPSGASWMSGRVRMRTPTNVVATP